MKSLYKHTIRTAYFLMGFFIVIASTVLPPECSGQDFKSEKDLAKRAEKFFQNEDYIIAEPLFSQLRSTHPNDVNYDYKFSVSNLYAKKDKEKALAYLKRVAANPNCDKKVFYYLGRAYHLNYRFSEAIGAYKKFKKLYGKKGAKEFQVDRQIEMCNNGLELLRDKTPLIVLKKTEIKESEYFRSYDMEMFKGNLVVKPDDFKSKTDKEKEEYSIIFVGKKVPVIYYSSYGVNGDNKDIYKIEKRYDGSFSSPSRLSDVINTPYDEDFPFMHPDGKTLYFCSKGHNSMGGYDIFKTTYDSISGSWTEPVNLDFPINSADDDIFYLATDDEMVANFSSMRTSIKGMITVYKVKLEHKPGVREILAVREKSIAGEEPDLLALEEIKEIVELNVNATEEELATLTADYQSDVAIGSDIAERERAPDLMETKSAEIAALSDLTNEQIISIAYENAQILDDKAKKLKQEAEITSSIADKKQELATVKAEKAESILATIKNVKDEDQKQIEMQKAEELKTESEQLEREAEVASNLAVLLESNADKKQKEAETALSKSRQIESAVAENSIEESIVMLAEQKRLVESSDEQSIGAEGVLSDIEQRVEQKRVEADESYEKIQYIENEIAEIKNEVEILREEASISKDVQINKEQLQQLEEELKESEKELAVTYEKAANFETEAKTLQKKADVIYEVTREIEESTSEVEVALAEPSEIGTVKEEPFLKEPAISPTLATSAREEPILEEPATSVHLTSSETSAQQDEVDIVEEVALETKLEKQSEDYSEEAELVREEASAIDDPYFKERALQEGEELEEAAETKQIEAAESQMVINKYEFEKNQSQLAQKSNASALPVNRQSSLSMKGEETAYVQELEAEAQTLFDAALDIRENANSIEDSETKIIELQKANDMEVMAIGKQQEAIDIYEKLTPDPELSALSAERASAQETFITSAEKAEEEEYPAHRDSLHFFTKGGYDSWPEAGPPLATGGEEDRGEAIDVEDEIALATKFEEQSKSYTVEAESIREKANTLDDPYFKERALQEAEKLEQAAQEKQEEADVHYENVREFEQSEQAGRESYEIEDTGPTDGAKISQGKELVVDRTEEVSQLPDSPQESRTYVEEEQKEQGEAIIPAYVDALPAGPETLDENPEDLNRSRQSSVDREEAMDSEEDENYTALISESEEIMQNAITEHEKSEELRMESEYQRNTAQRLLGSLDTITDPVVFKETFNEAEELEQFSKINAAKADSIDQIAENTEVAAISKIHEAESYLQSSPPPSEGVAPFVGRSPSIPTQSVEKRQRTEISTLPDYQESEIAMTNEPIEPEPVFLATTTYPSTAASSSASILEYDMFETLPVSVYSESNPIPINKKLPRGVVFKVQIGAFRNPIPQDLFKGISPLRGEKTSMGFIRYTAGMFKEFRSANKAKNTIRGLGYSDAFVVAFNNGKRVTPDQAMAMLGEKPIESGLLTKDAWSGIGEMALANIPGITPASPTDLSSIKGLLYTVQIGVYSKPVTSAQLHNVNPVYGTTTSEGYIRYTHGIYGDLITAISARKDIVDKGIKDAFVTAYYNGKKISIGRAKTLEISGLSGREEQPYSGGSEGISLRFIPPPEADRPLAEEGAVVYKVQIGAFKDEVPVEIASIYLDLVGMGIDQYRDENDFTIYTAGSFIDRESAEELKDIIVSKGITDAFVSQQLAAGSSRQTARSGQMDMAQAERLMQEAEEKTIVEAAARERVEEEKRARVEEERKAKSEEENKERAGNEAERLVSEIQDAYTSVETLEKSAKDNMKRATALLSDVSIELEDDVKEREMQKAEELVQRAIIQHQQAKNTFELAQELEASARDKMLISGFSENHADDYLRTIVSFEHNEGLISRMSEAEAGALQQEVSDAYNHAEELQNNTRDNITQAHDVLYNSETINDEIKQLVQNALGEVEETRYAYDQAKNTLYAARYKMILGGYTKEYIDGSLIAISGYDNNLIMRMPESEAAGLQQEIKSAYLRVATSENVTRGKIDASQMLCDTINSDSNIGRKEEEISRAAELMQAAIAEHQQAKDALELAQNLEPVAQYKMLLGGYSKEEADDYLNAITPASYDAGLLGSLPETEAARLQQEVNDAYAKANEFQNNVSVQLEEAHSVLYAIEIIDERTKQLVEDVLEGVENAEYRYEQTEFKLYNAKCKMILGSYSKEDVNNRLIATSEFDENLIQRISGYEVEVLQEKTRNIFNKVVRLEDSAQRKLDESQNILDNAETIQYPDVKKREVERAGEIKLKAMLELQEAAIEQEKAQNVFEISKYKILLGGITEDEADYQRLEYITQ